MRKTVYNFTCAEREMFTKDELMKMVAMECRREERITIAMCAMITVFMLGVFAIINWM